MPAGEDPQQSTGETTFEMEHLRKMAMASVAAGNKLTLRNWAMMSFQALTVGRGEDVRTRYLSELMAPRFLSSIGGPHPPGWVAEGRGLLARGVGVFYPRTRGCCSNLAGI